MACYFQAVVDFKRVLLARTLAEHDGNRTRAAQALCLERSHFRRLLRDYGITVPAPRYHWPALPLAPEGLVMELSAFERFLHPEWRQLAELPRHRFVGPTVNGATYCDNCRKSINVTVWPAPCVIDTVGIACHDCGEPVFFPTTALDLELYLMKGTLCSACWTP